MYSNKNSEKKSIEKSEWFYINNRCVGLGNV